MPRFQPRVRKQRARRLLDEGNNSIREHADSNATEVLPEEQRERRSKHEALKAELKAGRPKFSAKKQKRLDKYIENKLKKDEHLDLLKKLSAAQTDTTKLRSSRNLGNGRGAKRGASEALREKKAEYPVPEEDRSGSDDALDSEVISNYSEWSGFSIHEGNPSSISDQPAVQQTRLVGTGLKRPLEIDSTGTPVIKKRQRPNQRTAATKLQELLQAVAPSSSDSTSGIGTDTDIETDAEISSEEDSDQAAEASSESEGNDDQFPMALFSGRHSASEAKNPARNLEFLEEWSKAASGIQDGPSHLEALAQLPEALRGSKPVKRDQATETEPSMEEFQPATEFRDRQAFHVSVTRPESLQEARAKLSVVAEEQKIMEAIHNHSVVVICGATGSGKTTQVPQFLFEAGYGTAGGPTPGMIAVTQPRRVAAVTMAKRVAEEMGNQSSKVSYQIRFDSTTTSSSSVKFMTDGILLRELADDFALSKYSVIVIDEAHERSVNTDILIGMLSRVVDLRRELAKSNIASSPLKLVIMSATLVAGDFLANERLFRKERPPLVEIEGRQYNVVEHFARRTQRDYLEQTFQKITRGHKKLPPGSMLVFLTGQNEISVLSKRLKRAFGAESSVENRKPVRLSGKDVPLEADDLELGEDRVEDYLANEDDAAGEAEDEGFDIDDPEASSSKAHILPLYSQLPTKEQLRVFEPPPEGTRLIILATNVAETSITIPGVRYVIDCGRSKVKKYDPRTGVQSFEIGWISKASALQRMGRAGRTGPGHCYRLYSSAVYEAQFADHTPPEMATAPMESVVLQIKSMQIPGGVTNFPFPSPPEAAEIVRAENLLASLGALDIDGRITNIGRALSLYPISPRFARMLVIGHQNGCDILTTALVAALATPEIFISESQLSLGKTYDDAEAEDDSDVELRGVYDQAQRLADDARAARQKAYNSAHSLLAQQSAGSDALKLLRAFGSYLAAAHSHHASVTSPSSRSNVTNSTSPEAECERLYMRPKACAEASNLHHQLLRLLALHHPTSGIDPTAPPPPPPTETQDQQLKQIVATGFIDQVALRFDLLDEAEQTRLAALHPHLAPTAPRKASDVAYAPLFGEDVLAFVHQSSVLARRSRKEMPPFIVYERLHRGEARSVAGQMAAEHGATGPSKGGVAPPRTRLFPLTPATGPVLRELARGTQLLEWGKPMGKIEILEPEDGVERRRVLVVPSLVNAGEKGARRKRWPLPAVYVVQTRDRKKGIWREERKG